MDNSRLSGARRYRTLRSRQDEPTSSAPKKSDVRFDDRMHDEQKSGLMSIMNSMYGMQRWEPDGRQAEGFKLAVLQWCSAYALAYSLMVTISFSMLTTKPLLHELPPEGEPFTLQDWRPRSHKVDTVVLLLYYFFASAACYDAAWGMLLTAEWGVRAGTVPADIYSRFIRHLEPDEKEEATRPNTMWAFRCFEPRAAHAGLRYSGCFSTSAPAMHIGFTQQPSWDPFYFVDRTVGSLFLAAASLVYLNNGLVPCGIVLMFLLALRDRVRTHGQVVIQALFRAYSESADDAGVALSKSEEAVKSSVAPTRGGWKKPSEAVSVANRLRGGIKSCGNLVPPHDEDVDVEAGARPDARSYCDVREASQTDESRLGAVAEGVPAMISATASQAHMVMPSPKRLPGPSVSLPPPPRARSAAKAGSTYLEPGAQFPRLPPRRDPNGMSSMRSPPQRAPTTTGLQSTPENELQHPPWQA